MTTNRLLVLTLLTVSGVLVSATAASVYAAGDAARRRPPGAAVSGRSDPLHPDLLNAAADRTQSAAVRLSVLEQIANGACFNTREMLFGASARRHRALDRAAAAMEGVPGLDSIRQQRHAQLAAFSAATPRLHASPGAPGMVMLRWLLPSRIETRVDDCRTVR